MTVDAKRRSISLPDAFAEFARHPSPWIIATLLVGSVAARVVVGDFQRAELLVPVVMLAVFPFFEWTVHIVLLHWKPRRVLGITVDPLLSRDHRRHHADPRDVPLVFIPWKTFFWIVPTVLAVGLLAFPDLGMGLTYIAFVALFGLVYEWTHYLIHTDYRPKSGLYRHLHRNHRLHHFKNEHYWFGVTTAGTADRVLRTYPEPAAVEKSPTARTLGVS